MFEYVIENYKVPACLGRVVIHMGNRGVITEDRGHYIGVNFDSDKAGVVKNVHPTDSVKYLGLGEIRKMTRSQERYKRYLEYGDCFDNFIEFCRWDAKQSW